MRVVSVTNRRDFDNCGKRGLVNETVLGVLTWNEVDEGEVSREVSLLLIGYELPNVN